VRQILGAIANNEDTFSVDGHELNQVSLVGVIQKPLSQPTNFNFQLDDGTGWIDVRIWDSEDSNPFQAEKQEKWREGTYVRVIGHLRSFSNKKSVIAFRVIPVENFNEITYHHLETIYVHLLHKHGPPSSGQVGGTNFFQGPPKSHNTANYSARGGGWTDLQRAVHACFWENGNSEPHGLTVDFVVHRLAPRYHEGEIREAVTSLSSEGHLYSTIDDDHFKATEG